MKSFSKTTTNIDFYLTIPENKEDMSLLYEPYLYKNAKRSLSTQWKVYKYERSEEDPTIVCIQNVENKFFLLAVDEKGIDDDSKAVQVKKALLNLTPFK